MTTLKFKCTLLSDVIINQKAASEGPNQTLDFIPGSNFLGIVASELYQKTDEKSLRENWEIFHSGTVRFGDAHPVKEGASFRSLRIPASMYYPKLKKPSEGCYVHHLIPDLEALKTEQLKQCRSGFYDFSHTDAEEVNTSKNFVIKSAYDKEERRSKDEQMYGYQSIQEGLTLYFEVEVNNDNLAKKISDALCGDNKRVGRSRTAQYGLVKIEKTDYNDIPSGKSKNEIVAVYADSRLIFLDDYGLPTFQPTPEMLGLSGEILWEKSQVRTFQYSPWNYTRKCFDTDRCGIEKGSVFVIKTSDCPDKSQTVGEYKNEGFGKVIYNPAFLNANAEGKAIYTPQEAEKEEAPESNIELAGTPLLNYLNQQLHTEKVEHEVYKKVNIWVGDNEKLFTGDTFASQWGKIRSIAMQNKSRDGLITELYGKEDAYLTHGVGADKWGEKKRLVKFKEFVKELTDENAQIAIINLAAEMAKKSKEGERK